MTTPWQDARRILCVRLDGLGAVLQTTPALRALRAAVPGRTLTLLASPSGAAALPFIPDLDEAVPWTAPWTHVWLRDGGRAGMPASASGSSSAATSSSARWGTLALVDRLAARRFDAAVVFTTMTQSPLPAALLCHLAGIPLRLAHCRDNPYALLTDWVPDPEPAQLVRHEVQRQLALVGRIGCRSTASALSFVPRPGDVVAARARLADAGIDPDHPWILLHPGAGAAAHRYPAAHWARVLRGLAQAARLPLVLTGSAAEADLLDAIRIDAGVPAVTLAGCLPLGELGAALQLAAVAVTGNAAPAHIAAAVGTPVVDLYALTAPQHTPWHVRSRVLFHDVPCRFCAGRTCAQGHHDCLAGVAPQRVVDAALELLNEPARAADGR
jgi:ADP-heptose:LPS heptosyltransferase